MFAFSVHADMDDFWDSGEVDDFFDAGDLSSFGGQTVASGGGGGSAYTFDDSGHGYNDGTGFTSIATASAIGVDAGDLLVAYVSYSNAEVGDSVGVSDSGSNTFTCGSNTVFDDANGVFCYKLSASANASATFTATMPSARRGSVDVWTFNTGSGTNSLDQENSDTGSSNISDSDNITTTGTYTVAIGGSAAVGGQEAEDSEIDGEVATGFAHSGSYNASFYKIMNVSAGAAIASGCNNDSWVGNIIAFKNE